MKTGRYQHYKGGEYIVIGVARHSETNEELVVYRPDYGDRGDVGSTEGYVSRVGRGGWPVCSQIQAD